MLLDGYGTAERAAFKARACCRLAIATVTFEDFFWQLYFYFIILQQVQILGAGFSILL